jgi:polysaccharide export outer membrane protein
MNKLFLLCGCSLGLMLSTGCQIPSHSNAPRFNPYAETVFANKVDGQALARQLDAQLLQPPQDLFTLGPGDILQIEVIGRPDSRTETTIGPDGKVYFDLLPGLDVWGLTLTQARRTLQTELEKFNSGVQISMSLRKVGSKHIWMLGALNQPGIYPTATPTTLLEALALAGGTKRSPSTVTTVDLADLNHAFVIRNGTTLPVNFQRLLEQGDMSQNIYLQPDDFIYVPSSSAREIYLFGAVVSPRAMPLSEHPTLLAAITSAGGPLRDAYISQVAIIRGSLTEPQVAIINYKDILEGRALDVPLEARDIVFVPNSPYRFLRNYVDAILNTFVYTVAANEGINAFGGNRVGISVPVGN